jgi:segregation and condensation protein A
MFDLLSALAGIFDRMHARPVHDIIREPFTVEQKMSLIEEKVGSGGTVRFEELFSEDTIKMEVIVTFIAILEMVKKGRLEFMQTESSGPIWIQRPGLTEHVGDDMELTTLDEDHAAIDKPDAPPNEWENES